MNSWRKVLKLRTIGTIWTTKLSLEFRLWRCDPIHLCCEVGQRQLKDLNFKNNIVSFFLFLKANFSQSFGDIVVRKKRYFLRFCPGAETSNFDSIESFFVPIIFPKLPWFGAVFSSFSIFILSCKPME